jgi:exodeoxyribonuclease V alpha subunit
MRPPRNDRPDSPDAASADLAAYFERHARRWADARGAGPLAQQAAGEAARRLSLATADGQVCLLLDELPCDSGLPPDLAAWREALLASRVVDTAEAPGVGPMVLDSEGRLYLHRYFDLECRLAARLRTASTAPAEALDAATVARLDELFGPDRSDGIVNDQKVAARRALERRLVVISGGPGTGKTTTVVQLLACLLVQQPGARIALAAPTGKAAARMTEAIRQRAAHLPEPVRQQLPAESFTVHRLLGVTPDGFSHDARRPLPVDVLVVDEASMLDLALATRLLEAVPSSARVILLGDRHQLAAVESGAVFSELCDSAVLPGAAVTLARHFRFGGDSGIGRLAADIRDGRAEAAMAVLRTAPQAGLPKLPELPELPELYWHESLDAGPDVEAILSSIARGYAPYLDTVRRAPHDVAAANAAFGRFRVLCAQRLGRTGVEAINLHMARLARQALGGVSAARGEDPTIDPTIDTADDARDDPAGGLAIDPQDDLAIDLTGTLASGPAGDLASDPRQSPAIDPARGLPGATGSHGSTPPGQAIAPPIRGTDWYPGRPVMVQRNDYLLKLFNGDIGITLPDEHGRPWVHFPDDQGGFRRVAPARLPPHDTAFAMTVHKAQGSEFDHVLVLLPARISRGLTRELLYTAVTRARERVGVAASPPVLAASIATVTHRHSGLAARIRERPGHPPAD